MTFADEIIALTQHLDPVIDRTDPEYVSIRWPIVQSDGRIITIGRLADDAGMDEELFAFDRVSIVLAIPLEIAAGPA